MALFESDSEFLTAFNGWEGFDAGSTAAIEGAEVAMRLSGDNQKPFPEVGDRIPGLLGATGEHTGLKGERLTALLIRAAQNSEDPQA